MGITGAKRSLWPSTSQKSWAEQSEADFFTAEYSENLTVCGINETSGKTGAKTGRRWRSHVPAMHSQWLHARPNRTCVSLGELSPILRSRRKRKTSVGLTAQPIRGWGNPTNEKPSYIGLQSPPMRNLHTLGSQSPPMDSVVLQAFPGGPPPHFPIKANSPCLFAGFAYNPPFLYSRNGNSSGCSQVNLLLSLKKNWLLTQLKLRHIKIDCIPATGGPNTDFPKWMWPHCIHRAHIIRLRLLGTYFGKYFISPSTILIL